MISFRAASFPAGRHVLLTIQHSHTNIAQPLSHVCEWKSINPCYFVSLSRFIYSALEQCVFFFPSTWNPIFNLQLNRWVIVPLKRTTMQTDGPTTTTRGLQVCSTNTHTHTHTHVDPVFRGYKGRENPRGRDCAQQRHCYLDRVLPWTKTSRGAALARLTLVRACVRVRGFSLPLSR